MNKNIALNIDNEYVVISMFEVTMIEMMTSLMYIKSMIDEIKKGDKTL